MQPNRTIPNDMNEICRLCLSSEGRILPIFGDEDVDDSQIPLSFRILACVSVEVSLSDGLPSLICQQCLKQVDSWTEFKQQCDTSQVTLKEWQRTAAAAAAACSLDSPHAATVRAATPPPEMTTASAHSSSLDKVVTIKQEPVDVDEEEDVEVDHEDNMTEVIDDADIDSSVLCEVEMRDLSVVDIKQEEIEMVEERNVEEVGVDSHTAIKSEPASMDVQPATSAQRHSLRPRRLLVARRRFADEPEIFSCWVCHKEFGNKSHLLRHELTHNLPDYGPSQSYKNLCTICNKGFSNRSNLDRHMRLHKNGQPLLIRNASSVNQNGIVWPQSESDDNGGQGSSEAMYCCYLCNKSFLSQYRLKAHMSQHSNYKCSKCGKTFKGGTALSNHLRTHNIRGFKRHTCRFCMRSFGTLTAMISHRKTHYRAAGQVNGGPAPPPAPAAPPATSSQRPATPAPVAAPDAGRVSGAPCRICNKWLSSFTLLERHMMTHTKQKPYTCSVCGLSLGYASSVHKHMRYTHGIVVDYNTIRQQLLGTGPPAGPPAPRANVPPPSHEPPPVHEPAPQQNPVFPCMYCSRTFVYKSLLMTHVRTTHEGSGSTHDCQVCGHAFAHRYLLLRHIKTHGGFFCTVCMKRFSDLKTLNNHKGVHKRFKLYQCPTCGQCFNGLQRWEAHRTRAHPNSAIPATALLPLRCFTCGERFATRAELAVHRQGHIRLKLYTCTVCKNSYNSSSALSKHKRKHAHYDSPDAPAQVEEEKPHVCSECGKVFGDHLSLVRHRAVHARRLSVAAPKPPPSPAPKPPATPVKPASPAKSAASEESHCVLCNRTFRDHMGLIRHKGWHTRRPNTVPIVVNSQNNSAVPRAAAPSSRSFPCDYCDKVYSNAGSLSKHRRTNCPRLSADAGEERTPPEGDADGDEDVKPVLQPLVLLEEGADESLAGDGHPCTLCPKVFRTAKALVVHRGWHARTPARTPTPQPPTSRPTTPRPPPPGVPSGPEEGVGETEAEGRSYTLVDTTDTEDESKYYRTMTASNSEIELTNSVAEDLAMSSSGCHVGSLQHLSLTHFMMPLSTD